MTAEQIQALRALRDLPPQERIRQMYELDQADLAEAERQKDVGPIAQFRLSDEEWKAFRDHLLDGGGVEDAPRVIRSVYTALFDGDQETFWREQVHLLKSIAKHFGVLRNNGGGQVFVQGVAPTAVTEAANRI